MSDQQLLELLSRMQHAPRWREAKWMYTVLEDVVVVSERLGKGERWTFAPSHDVVRLVDGMVPQASAYRFSTAALRFVYRATRMDFVRHARAMGARVL